jgi:1-acyl-sn-glycerol-3-phosphate acyltransferase
VNILRYLLVFLWTAILVTLSFVAFLVTFNRRVPIKMARLHWAPGVLWICRIKLQVEGLDHIDFTKPYIFVSNHQSALDIPVLFRAVPVELHFIAKKEVKQMPFVGWYMWMTGMIFIDRTNREKSVASLERAGKLIKKGKHVIMFPEGTRSKDGQVLPFKKGPFVLSSQAGIPIVPIAIAGTERAIAAWGWFSKAITVHVAFGAPISKQAEQDLNAYLAVVRDQVIGIKKG